MLSTCLLPILIAQRSQHHLKFQTRLCKLGLGFGIGNNATSCKESCFPAIDQSRTQCYRELTMTARANPSKRASIPTSIEFLGVSYRFESSMPREAADSRCGVQICHYIKHASTWDEFTGDSSLQVLYIFKLEQLWSNGDMYVGAMLFKRFSHHRYDNRMLAVILSTL